MKFFNIFFFFFFAAGDSAYVVTTSDYLARRDGETMGQVN